MPVGRMYGEMYQRIVRLVNQFRTVGQPDTVARAEFVHLAVGVQAQPALEYGQDLVVLDRPGYSRVLQMTPPGSRENLPGS